MVQFIGVGLGNLIAVQRVISLVSPDSAPVRRLIQEARDRGMVVDASGGKKCKAVFVMDSEHVVLSSLELEVVGKLLQKNDFNEGIQQDELL